MALGSSSRKEFKPTDDQLLRLFLYNKVHGKPVPNDATILEYDLFGERNPWEIWQEFEGPYSYDEKDLYFFTILKRKFEGGTSGRVVRTIGCGAWEGEDVGKAIVATDTKQNLGMKKRYRFEKSGTEHDGGWILHEYSLHSSLINTDPSAVNYVLCRFRKNLRHNTTTGRRNTRPNVPRVTRQRRTVVLALEVTHQSDINDVGLGEEDICEGPLNHADSGNNITEMVETSTRAESECEDEEDGDPTLSFGELFALELRSYAECLTKEEDIPMLPNTFYRDLLSENIDIKYLK
ncbi:NAC domain [Sesbania bispinosa]|nr:NAC domain [Sesbania bispinosa]